MFFLKGRIEWLHEKTQLTINTKTKKQKKKKKDEKKKIEKSSNKWIRIRNW